MIGKFLASKACELVKGWDGALPADIVRDAKNWASEFSRIGEVVWPRYVGIEDAVDVKLCGECDASDKALGACVYLVSTDKNGNVTSNLVMSKTRLAPKIKHSTPRLELLSAVLLVNVMEHVRLTYSDIPDENVYYFSDSADVIFLVIFRTLLLETFRS